jgi:hypothetical protein
MAYPNDEDVQTETPQQEGVPVEAPTVQNIPPLQWEQAQEGQVQPAPMQTHDDALKQLNETYGSMSQAGATWLKGGLSYWSKQYSSGNKGVVRANAYFDAWAGMKNVDEIKRDFSNEKLDSVESQGIDPVTYTIGVGAGALPGIMEVGKAGFALGTAFVGGAAAMGQVHPAELGAAATAGFTGGSFASAFHQGVGAMYAALLDRGIDPSQAKVGAAIAGAVQGALTVTRFGFLSGAVQKEVAAKIGEGAIRQAIASTITQGVRQAEIGEAQAIANDSVKAIQAVMGSNPKAIPTADEWGKDLAENAQQGFILGAASGVAIHGSGFWAKHIISAINKPAIELKAQNAKADAAIREEMMQAAKPVLQTEQAAEQPKQILQGRVEENVPKKAEKIRSEAREDIAGQLKDANKSRVKAEEALDKRLAEDPIAKMDEHIRDQRFKIAQFKKQGATEALQKAEAKLDSLKNEKLRVKTNIANLKEDVRAWKESESALKENAEALETAHRKIAVNDLKNEVKSIAISGKETKFSQSIQTKYDPEATVQDVLAQFKKYVENPEEVKATEDKYFQAAVDNKLTHELEMEYGIAQEVGDLKSKSIEELEDLRKDIAFMKEKGLKGKLAEKAEEARKLHAIRQELLAGVQGNRPANLEPTGKGRTPTLVGSVKKALKSHGLTMKDYNGIVRQVVQDTVGKENREKLVGKLSLDQNDRAVGNRIRQQNMKLNDSVQEATGLSAKKILHLASSMEKPLKNKQGKNYKFIGQDGKPTEFEGTRAEAAYYLAAMNDPSLQAGLYYGNKFTFGEGEHSNAQVMQTDYATMSEKPVATKVEDTTEKVLSDALTDDEKNYIQGVANYYQEIFPELAKKYKEETGFDLPKEDFYSGLAKRKGKAGEGSLVSDIGPDFNNYMHGRVRSDSSKAKVNMPGSFIARIPNSRAVMPQSITANVLNSIDKNSRWIEMANSDVKLKAYAWQDTDITTALSRKFDEAAPGIIQQASKDVINGPSRYATGVIGGITQFMANAGETMFTGDITRGIKHMTTHLYVLYDVPFADYVQGSLDYHANPQHWINLLGQSEVFNRRYVDFREEFGGAALKRSTYKSPYSADIEHALWSFFSAGAKESDLWGGTVIYKYALKQTGSHEAAMKAFEDYLEKRQFSRSPTSTSEIVRNPNTGWMVAWQNIPLKVYQAQTEAFTNMVHATPQELPGAVAYYGKVVGSTVVASAIFHGIDTAWRIQTAKTQKQKDQAIFDLAVRTLAEATTPPPLSPWSAYGYGQIINKAREGIAEREGTAKPEHLEVGEPNHFLYSAAINGGKLAGDLVGQAISGKVDAHDAYEDLRLWMQTGNIKFGKLPAAPVRGFLKLTEPQKESEESKAIKL